MMNCSHLLTVLLLNALLVFNAYSHNEQQPPSELVNVAVGEVTESSALLWIKTEHSQNLTVKLSSSQASTSTRLHLQTASAYDNTGRIVLSPLEPNTLYDYTIYRDKNNQKIARGQFSTAPQSHRARRVKLVWSGDFAGQNVCRDKHEGFAIFKHMRQRNPDIVIGLGDMIYADNTCEATGRYGNPQIAGAFPPAQSLAEFWQHWRYLHEDPNFQQLTSESAYFSIWDDHEVVNDFGPKTHAKLLKTGLKAFTHYNPVNLNRKRDAQIYRNLRWGKHLEIFFLDNRQFRDSNQQIDRRDHPKSMLGETQKHWLISAISQSDATWKVIASSVPVAVPTGGGDHKRDGWANFTSTALTSDKSQQLTGYENELREILNALKHDSSLNLIFITTDVHFGQVLEYAPTNLTPLEFHEFIIGPGNAGIFPNPQLDESFQPVRLFYYAPDSMNAVDSWETAKNWFNFGEIAIDDTGDLNFTMLNGHGNTVFTKLFRPRAKLSE